MKSFIKTFTSVFGCLLAIGLGINSAIAQSEPGNAGEATIAPSGTVTITSQGTGTVTKPPLKWFGVSSGAVPQPDEGAAIDGVNHDFFILTVAGLKSDWVGKQIAGKIEWTPPTKD